MPAPGAGMSARPEPDWIDRQLRRRGIENERVLAAMARVPLAGTSWIPGTISAT